MMYKYVKPIATVFIVAIVCVCITYSCTENNRQYYEAFRQCVDSGGTVIPSTAANSDVIACVKR